MRKCVKYCFLILILLISFCGKAQKNNEVYSDSSASKMVVTKLDSSGRAISFSTIKTDYSIEYLTIYGQSACYAVKKTSKLDGGNAAEALVWHHLISVDFTPVTNNTLKPFSIKCDCNEIVLHDDYYETITYGCCGAPTIHTYYLYSSNKEICEGELIKSYEIPCSPPIDCFIGYESYPDAKDSNNQFVFIGYNNGELYKLKFLSQDYYFRTMEFKTGHPGDEFMGILQTTQRIYSLGKIRSVAQINNLKISLVFKNMNLREKEDEKVVDIPIINGKPFGKDATEQTLNISEIK